MPDKIVTVTWTGNSPMSFTLPGRGRSFKFKSKIRTTVDAEIWNELIDPVNGPARLHFAAKKLRVTTAGGGVDIEEVAASMRVMAPAVPVAAAPQDQRLRDENAQLKSEVARLAKRLEMLDKVEPAGPAEETVPASEHRLLLAELEKLRAQNEELSRKHQPAPAPVAQPEPVVDFTKLSVPKLAAAIEGLDLDALERVKAAEVAGKGRAGALEAIEAAINKLLEGEPEQG